MSDNPWETIKASAEHARALDSITDARELIAAAKWNNPQLVQLVRRYPSETQAAIDQLTQNVSGTSDLLRQETLKITLDRLVQAQQAATRALVELAPVVLSFETLPQTHELVRRVTLTVQERLDMIPKDEQHMLWWQGVPQLIELEQQMQREYVDPLVADGTIKRGVLRLWIGPHPTKPGTHHELAVHSVTLEV